MFLLKQILQLFNLNVNLFMIAQIGLLDLSPTEERNARKLLNLDKKAPEDIILDILIDVHHMGGHIFDLTIIHFAALSDEPGQNLGPVQLKHFQFSVSEHFSNDEFSLYEENTAVQYFEFF